MPEDHEKTVRESAAPALERHYTVPEICKLWHLDEKTIRKIFEQEPGVISFGSAETRYKRKYVSLRIPESTLLRVHAKLMGRVTPKQSLIKLSEIAG